MKPFILLLIKIVGILLVLNFVLLFLIRNFGASRFEDYYRSIDRISEEHYSLLITGDSHANDCWRRIDTPGVADLSFPGDNYVDILNKLHYLNNEQIKYDVHLMEVDPQVFSTYRESSNNNDLSLGLRYGKAGIWIQMNFPLFFNPRIETEILSIFKKPEDDSPDKKATEIDTSSMASRAGAQFFGMEFSNKMVNKFTSSIELTLEGGGKPVFIHYPFYPSYLDMVDTSIIYTESMVMVNSILDIQKWQFLNYGEAVCDSRYFYNQDHVNEAGARLLFGYIQSCLRDGIQCNGKCRQQADPSE